MDAMKPEDILRIIRNRVSIRRFKRDPIPDEYLSAILEAGRWAPSAGNAQPWEFVVVRDEGKKKRITDIYMEQRVEKHKMELTRRKVAHHLYPPTRPVDKVPVPGFLDAPVFVLTIGDPRVKIAYPLRTIKDKGESHFITSLANAVVLMHLTANALGLGTCYASDVGSPYMEAMVRDLLGIPEVYKVYELMPVGYPAEDRRLSHRRSLREIAHVEQYDLEKYRTDEDIEQFVNEKAHMPGRFKPFSPVEDHMGFPSANNSAQS